MENKQTMIEVQNLCKSFHKLEVLKDISTTFYKNEVVSIIGPSGGGKSTFLRCLNLLEKPTSGHIVFDGVDICDRHQNKNIDLHRQKMGMVFQQFNLFNNMNVMKNLTVAPMRIKKMPKEQAEEKAVELLRKVGLADRAEAYPSQLSGGQKQRIAIVRSLMMDPEAILFDEPTSALDPEMIGEVLDVMKALAADGMTMIVVTHEMRFAREVAARTIFLADGKIEEDKPSHELFDNPESPRLVTFQWLPGFLSKLGQDDLVIVTADHGCDPGYLKHTDHTREYIPMIALGKAVKPVNLGTRLGFCDIAATVAELLDVPYETPGRSFAKEIV